MKVSASLLTLTASVALLGHAHAVTALIDFGDGGGSQIAPSPYNLVAMPGANVSGVTSGAVALIDTTTTLTGWSVTVTETGSGTGGDAGSGANVSSFPAAITGFDNNAIRDSIFANGTSASMAVTLTGLDSSSAYDLLFYGSRGNGQSKAQRWTITTGTGGSVVTHGSGLNSTTVVDWDGIIPDGSGTIAFTIDSTTTINGALALNFGEITQIPEPSAIALFGFAGLLLGRRRR